MTKPDGGAAAPKPQETEPCFHENWEQRLRRWGLGVLYALKPSRIALLPRLWLMTLTYYLTPRPERDALPALPRFYSDRGLIGISNDLSVPALIANYARGYFPVCHIGPMKWWCPEERAVLDPAETHVSNNVRRMIRRHKFTVTMDKDFAGVMEACARPREQKFPLTWITPQIMSAFWKLTMPAMPIPSKYGTRRGIWWAGSMASPSAESISANRSSPARETPPSSPPPIFTGTSPRGDISCATPSG